MTDIPATLSTYITANWAGVSGGHALPTISVVKYPKTWGPLTLHIKAIELPWKRLSVNHFSLKPAEVTYTVVTDTQGHLDLYLGYLITLAKNEAISVGGGVSGLHPAQDLKALPFKGSLFYIRETYGT